MIRDIHSQATIETPSLNNRGEDNLRINEAYTVVVPYIYGRVRWGKPMEEG